MYSVIVLFALIQHDGDGRIVETHGKFADAKSCEYAASIVHQELHPLPNGHDIVCQRRAVVQVTASYQTNNDGDL